jgi:MazG family protein
MKIDADAMSTFQGLRDIVAALRAPDGCPWDRVQTHSSLAPYLLEEASEVLDALEEGDPPRLCDEMGDLLLEVLLQVQIAEEMGEFTLADVIGGVAAKLVRRHPHVFGGVKLETPQQVVEQWEELKRAEREGDSVLAGIPVSLPALARAQALRRRAARNGFRWESVDGAWHKLREELAELERAEKPPQRQEEVGDALFALCELALRQANRRFSGRFQDMETRLHREGREMSEVPLEELPELWREAKRWWRR